ncbi:hypothetical protein ACHQM5_007907 [Ranunculus cassubicifolius]
MRKESSDVIYTQPGPAMRAGDPCGRMGPENLKKNWGPEIWDEKLKTEKKIIFELTACRERCFSSPTDCSTLRCSKSPTEVPLLLFKSFNPARNRIELEKANGYFNLTHLLP